MKKIDLHNKYSFKKASIIPGFGPALGFTLFYLGLVVLLPLSTLFLKTATLTWSQFFAIMTDPRVVASFKLSFGAAAVAVTWTLLHHWLDLREATGAP